MFNDRLIAAAQPILNGDDSMVAAAALEAVLLDDYPDDDRFEDLLETLAAYRPGEGVPYFSYAELLQATRDALVLLV